MILYYDTWPNVNMPRGIKKNLNIKIKLVSSYVGKYVPR
jgi:hypothetical protein